MSSPHAEFHRPQRRTTVPLPLLLLWFGLLIPITADAHPGWGMERMSDGRIAFTDIFHGTIWAINPEIGSPSLTRLIDSYVHVHQLSVAPDGSLLAEEHDYRDNAPMIALHRIAPDGALHTLFGPYRSEREVPGFLRDASGAWFGTFHHREDTAGPRLHRWSPDGNHNKPIAGGVGDLRDGRGDRAGFKVPGSLAWAADSTFLVGDYGAVRIVSRDGHVHTIALDHPLLGPGDDPFFRDQVRPYLYGIRDLGNGDLLVANFGRGALVRITRHPVHGTDLEDVYLSPAPWAVVNVLPEGRDLLLLEAGSLQSTGVNGMRLLRLSPNGHTRELANTADR